MPTAESLLTKRYAITLALLYFLVRCVPDLFLIAANTLPDAFFFYLIENHSIWLRHAYPILPVQVFNVPWAFQQVLALLPVLIFEVLLVFLFSAWFLRRKPWVVQRSSVGRWLLFIVISMIWVYAVRHQLLLYLQGIVVEPVLAAQKGANWMDELPVALIRSHWLLSTALYLSTPLWAAIPVWIHFQWVQKPTQVAQHTTTALPLQQASVFASFLLGCLGLHTAFVQLTYLGLWPWAVEQSGAHLPLEALNDIGLLLALSQIVLAALVCTLAAYVYCRRYSAAKPPIQTRLIPSFFAGMATYLLTSLLFLALVWLISWLQPSFIESLIREFSYSPENGIPFIIALNFSAFVLLCLISRQFRIAPKRWNAALAVLLLCAAVPSYVVWTLTRTNLGLAGAKPGFTVTGMLGDSHWRSTEQWCTGVVETSHGTWLIGRNDDSLDSASYVPEDVPDLSQLLNSNDENARSQGFGFFGSRPTLTTLALLQDDGTFTITAAIPDVTCMVVSPVSETLYLFTGIRRPATERYSEPMQTAVFRSTDQGSTWEWLESGFMSEAQQLAWNVKPIFASDHEVWAWGTVSHDSSDANPQPTALFYSADQGKTSTEIVSPEALVVSDAYLSDITGEPDAKFSSGREMSLQRFVVQVDDQRAYAWVSERTWYYLGEEGHRFLINSRAELTRSSPNSQWEVKRVVRQPDTSIAHLHSSADGRSFAIMHDNEGEWLVRLDPDSGEWVDRQPTPSILPSWLATDNTSTRYFWSNGDYQVISQWGRTIVPRLLIPFSDEAADIDTDAHFYTRDGGRNWRQLAIPGYLGIMGLSPRGSHLFWTKGNWYSNDEPLQWQYDLAK